MYNYDDYGAYLILGNRGERITPEVCGRARSGLARVAQAVTTNLLSLISHELHLESLTQRATILFNEHDFEISIKKFLLMVRIVFTMERPYLTDLFASFILYTFRLAVIQLLLHRRQEISLRRLSARGIC